MYIIINTYIHICYNMSMTKLHEIEILNSLLDDYSFWIRVDESDHHDASRTSAVEEIRAKIITHANRLIALRTRDL